MVEAAEADEAQEAFTRPGSHQDPTTHEPMTFKDFSAALAQVKKEWDDQLNDQAAKKGSDPKKLRAEWNVDELMKVIQRVKRQTSAPVTTGETWDIWLDRDLQKLASAVDFIGYAIASGH